MSKQLYDLHLRVLSASKLATIIQLLDGEAVLVKVSEVNDSSSTSTPPRKSRYANGMRYKGVLARDVILDALKSSPKTTQEITTNMTALGFATNSASPALSKLRKDLEIVQRDGKWTLPK